MKTAKNSEVNREVALLRALRNEDIDTSDLPEVTDWGFAMRGTFHAREHVTIAEPIDFENPFPDMLAKSTGSRPDGQIDSKLRKEQLTTAAREQPDLTLWGLRQRPIGTGRAGRGRGGRWGALLQRLGLLKKVPDVRENEE